MIRFGLRLGPEEDDRRRGQEIGPYILLERIGHGGMGVAYLAKRQSTNHREVVKLINPALAATNPRATELFLKGFEALKGLQHGGIVKILHGDIHTDPEELGGSSFPYFAMSYESGEPITTYRQDRSMDVTETLDIFLRACKVIEFAHGQRFIHCDLKPQHILIDEDGNPHVLDFGLARLFDPSLPVATRELFAGTPAYMSPEQVWDGEGWSVGFHSDVYALGMILFELLSGRRPYLVNPNWPKEAIRRAIVETEPEALGPIDGQDSDELARIVSKAIRKHPKDRYKSVQALMYDLRKDLDGQRRNRELRKGRGAGDPLAITLKDNIIIRIRFGRLEETPVNPEDTIVALPANEFFDDESFDKKATSVGGFFVRHFEDRIDELKEMVKSRLQFLKPIDTRANRQGVLASCYEIGSSVFLDRPFGKDLRILLVSCSTEREAEGNRAEPDFLSKSAHAIHELIKDQKLYRKIVMPLFCSGNARMNPVRALHYLLLGFCETINKSNPAHFEEITIVIFKGGEGSAAQVDPTHIIEQLSFIHKIYNP